MAGRLSAGATAIIVIAVILGVVGIATYLYQNGDGVIRQILSASVLSRLGAFSPFTFLSSLRWVGGLRGLGCGIKG